MASVEARLKREDFFRTALQIILRKNASAHYGNLWGIMLYLS
jgi:hypothetical protein